MIQQQQKIQTLPIDVLNDTYHNLFGSERFEILRQALIDCEAVIAGGGVLAPYADYHVFDLDIYVNVEFIQDFYLVLRNVMNYQIGGKNKWGNVAPPYDESFFKKNNILARFRLYHEHLPSIDLMMIPDDIPVRQVVTNFDLSFCQVWYDGQTVETNHERDILTKHGFLQKEYQESLFQKFNWFIISRILKYNQRGFKVQVSMTPALKKFMTKNQGVQQTQQIQASRKPIFVNVLKDHFTAAQVDTIMIHQYDESISIDILILEDYGPYNLNYVSNFPIAEQYSTFQTKRQVCGVTSPEEWVAKKIYKALIRLKHDDGEEDYERSAFWIMRHPLYPATMETVNDYLEEVFTNDAQKRQFLITMVFNNVQYYNRMQEFLEYMTTYTGLELNDLLSFYDQLRLPLFPSPSFSPFELPGYEHLPQQLDAHQRQMLTKYFKSQGTKAQLQHLPNHILLKLVRDFKPTLQYDQYDENVRQLLFTQLQNEKKSRQGKPKQRELYQLKKYLSGQSASLDIDALSKDNILTMVKIFNPSVTQQATKQQLYTMLQNQRKRRIQQIKAAVEKPTQQTLTDPFTEEYLTDPVLASDGVIYNKSTVETMLRQMGMVYNQNHQLVPNFPRSALGVITGFHTIQQLQQANATKAQQLKQIRQKALKRQLSS